MARSAPFPRVSACLDHATAQAVVREADERWQTRADFLRDAVANELRIRTAVRDFIAGEAARRGEIEIRLHRLTERGPSAGAAARLAVQAADAARPALTAAEAVRAYTDRTRIPRRPRPTHKDPSR